MDAPVDIGESTPEHPSYVGNRPTFTFGGVLPEEWLAAHDLVDDQVEVYVVGDAVVLLPSRTREEVARFFAETLDAETYRRLTAGDEAGSA